MTFAEFDRAAWDEWDRIPEEYRAGVDGLVIDRRALPHPETPDVYTLGECVTEGYPSEFGGPETTRSVVVLYYGSFFRLSRLDDEFDWHAELWETLTHELQHHLEALAAEDALVDMDYAADENHRRYRGEPFDPFFFRHGLPEDGGCRVEDEVFLEVPAPEPGSPVRFDWSGATYELTAPAEPADVAFLRVTEGVADPPRTLHVVLVARRGWLETLRALLRPRPARVLEEDAVARRV